MATWAIDGNSWSSDQTNWNTAPLSGSVAFSLTAAQAVSSLRVLVGAVTFSMTGAVTSEGTAEYPASTIMEVCVVNCSTIISASSVAKFVGAATISGSGAVAASSVAKLVGDATITGSGSLAPVAIGNFAISFSLDSPTVFAGSARLFWEPEDDVSTTWTDKSDDVKP